MDYVDIFYSHRPDKDTPLEETLGALDRIVRSGKALYAGISSYSGSMTAEAVGICERDGLTRPIIHQPNYSMLNRGIERDLLPATDRLGLGVIAFCPLAQGLLTDKYLDDIPDDSRGPLRRRLPQGGPDHARPAWEAPPAQRPSRSNAGSRWPRLALAWVLRDGQVTSALIGASRPSQIEQNVDAAANTRFSEDELAEIDAALAAA